MATTDAYASAAGRFYSFYIARPWLGRVVGRTLWGSDFRGLYRQLDELSTLGSGTVLLDLACGAGLALRWLDPSGGVRYVGVDRSPAMLARARRTARRRGHGDVELRVADAAATGLPDAVADTTLLCNALHCVDDPSAVIAEAVRCSQPGAPVLGSMLVRGAVPRADKVMDADGAGLTGVGGTIADLRRWLDEQLVDVDTRVDGALALFRARTPAAP